MGDLPSTWFLVHLWSGITYRFKPTRKWSNTINHNDGNIGVVFLSFLRYGFSQFIDVLCSLWEACRATAAAPTYFPPAFVTSVDGKFQGTMIDGGAIQNNPVSLPWLIQYSDCFLIHWWHFEVQLGVFWKKNIYIYHHAPNSTARILYNKDNIQK